MDEGLKPVSTLLLALGLEHRAETQSLPSSAEEGVHGLRTQQLAALLPFQLSSNLYLQPIQADCVLSLPVLFEIRFTFCSAIIREIVPLLKQHHFRYAEPAR